MSAYLLRRTLPGHPSAVASPDDWGIADLRLEFVTQDTDKLTFTAARAFDATEDFPYGAMVELLRDGTVVFLGRVAGVPRRGASESESLTYDIAGPWWYLDHIVFEQDWRFPDTAPGAMPGDTVLKPSTRVLLGRNLAGHKIKAAELLAEVFAFIAAKFPDAPISLGTVHADLDTEIPAEEARDLTCAEVIRRVLRWFPGIRPVWDLSSGHAALRFGAAGSDRFTLNPAADPIVSVELTPRPDLRPSCVVLRYQRNDSVQGSEAAVDLIEDKWPSAADAYALDALRLVIQLEGASGSLMSQRVESVPIMPGSADWWRTHIPHLTDAAVSALTVVPGSSSLTLDPESGASGNPYSLELVDGAVPAWTTYGFKPAIAKARITYTVTLTDGSTQERTEIVTCRLRTTDATTGTYWNNSGYTPPETPPAGLAQRYYNALAALQYDGSLTHAPQEWDGINRAGHALDLAGFPSRPEWASMAATVTRHTVDLATARATYTLGPAKHLNPDDWISLARPARGQIHSGYATAQLRATGRAPTSSLLTSPAATTPRTGATTLSLSAAGGGSQTTGEFTVTSAGGVGSTRTYSVAPGSLTAAFASCPFIAGVYAPAQVNYSSPAQSVVVSAGVASAIYGWVAYPPAATPCVVNITTTPPDMAPWMLFYAPPKPIFRSDGTLDKIAGGFTDPVSAGASSGVNLVKAPVSVIPATATGLSASGTTGDITRVIGKGLEYHYSYALVSWDAASGHHSEWREVTGRYYATTEAKESDFYYTYHPSSSPSSTWEAYRKTFIQIGLSSSPGPLPAWYGSESDNLGRPVSQTPARLVIAERQKSDASFQPEVVSYISLLSGRTSAPGDAAQTPAPADKAAAEANKAAVDAAFGGAANVPASVTDQLNKLAALAGSKNSTAGVFVFLIADIEPDGTILQRQLGSRQEAFAAQLFIKTS